MKREERQDAITPTKLFRALSRNGWVSSGSKDASEEGIEKAVKRYQRRFGLKADGWAGPITARTLTDRFCSVPDHAMAVRSQWDRDHARAGLKVGISSSPIASRSDYGATVEFALAHIPTVCGARFQMSANHKTADVVMGSHRERPGGVLAWSQLPNGSGSQLDQSYDSAERWYWADVDVERDHIGLIHVIRHEWGHALGLPHLGNWLMRPTYDPRASTFKGKEVDELLSRYGEPQATPDPDPEPKPGRRRMALIVDGVFDWQWEDRA